MDKLLYVDDENINVQLFRLSFRAEYEIITCTSALESIGIVEREDIKVVITDYKMPVMNGIELIERIKAVNPNVVCILLSGYLESDIVADKSKVFGHITKPYNKKEVLELLEKAFARLAVCVS